VGLALSFILNVALLATLVDGFLEVYRGHSRGEQDRERRQKLLDRARSLATHYAQGGVDQPFRAYLEGTPTYAALRGHLSRKYLSLLQEQRVLHAVADGALYDPLIEGFLSELDRLERKWGLA
jgi:hypothetical protein